MLRMSATEAARQKGLVMSETTVMGPLVVGIDRNNVLYRFTSGRWLRQIDGAVGQRKLKADRWRDYASRRSAGSTPV